MPLAEGAGFDTSFTNSPWRALAEQVISDRDFAEGKRQFSAFDLQTKEELLYLQKLMSVFDVLRVPHLTNRLRLLLPTVPGMHLLNEYVV